ncbi:hypothetical protein [Streptomyces bauhiniae]|uniref:hypothetical protein n=1 Tax=Streptomyces bauhiniae TaxID=2340725 RepID=UPI003665C082
MYAEYWLRAIGLKPFFSDPCPSVEKHGRAVRTAPPKEHACVAAAFSRLHVTHTCFDIGERESNYLNLSPFYTARQPEKEGRIPPPYG